MKERVSREQILSHKLFLQREHESFHLAYERELEFYDAVKNGDFETLQKIMLPLQDSKLGKLSQDSLRNLKYHLIITVALVTRFCIEGGLESETAYTLSDVYIQQIDACKDKESIYLLHQELVFDFADRKARQESLQNDFDLPVLLIVCGKCISGDIFPRKHISPFGVQESR